MERGERRLRGTQGAHPAVNRQLHTYFTSPGEGGDAARELGRRKLEQWRKENRKWRAKCSLARKRPAVGCRARSPSPVRPRRAPTTSPAAPTWQRLGPGQAAGLSPASPRLPLPCPGKGFEERRTGRNYARGRRPSSGRWTSPRRGCRSGTVCRERAKRCPASQVGTDSARAAGLAQSIPGGRGADTTSYRCRRSYCCAVAPPPAPAGPPRGGARGRGPAPAAVRWAGGVAARALESGRVHPATWHGAYSPNRFQAAAYLAWRSVLTF